jgi:hypothetical protein
LQVQDLKSDKTWLLCQQLLFVLQPHYLEATAHRQGPTPSLEDNNHEQNITKEMPQTNIIATHHTWKLIAKQTV